MATARVTLRTAKSYKAGGKDFVKDVPTLVHGEDAIKGFEKNGHFVVKRLKDAETKEALKKAEREEESDDEEDEEEEEAASTKSSKKSSKLKKKAG